MSNFQNSRRSEFWRGIVCLCGVLAGFSFLTASGQELIRAGGKTLGVNAAPAAANPWQSRAMSSKERLADDEYDTLTELDFFRQEFGKPVEAFSFVVASNGWSRIWGTTGRDHTAPAARFGRGWERLPAARYRLQMKIAQNVPETRWKLVRHVRFGYRNTQERDFTVRGNGSFTLDLGVITYSAQNAVNGIELKCLTTGAQVNVSDLLIAPYTYDVTWRRRFTLAKKPFRAGITFDNHSTYVLKANGRVISRGREMMGGGLRRVLLDDVLKAGENELEITANFAESYGPTRTFRVEAFAVDADGTVHLFPGGEGWEWRHGKGPWQKPNILGKVGYDQMPNGTLISDSSLPLHAGALDPKPANGTDYPVFEATGDVAWTCRVPPEGQAWSVRAEVTEALSGQPVESPVFTPDAAGNVRAAFAVRRPGAYLIAWTLRRGETVIDRYETEMVLTGRLDLPERAPDEMVRATEASKRLVHEIDCTRVEENPTSFLDHSYSYYEPRLNVGRVSRLASGVYRETGLRCGDLIAYRIQVGELGKPHLLEFDYPDDGERMIYCAIVEPLPVNFCNNSPPVGSRGWPNATGAVRCGGLMPVSGEKKTVQILFFPATSNATVYFENGLTGTRAAVSAVRVYQADELPAVKLPQTDRLYGNHDERPLCHPWGAFVNPRFYEYDGEYKWRFWTAAYHSAVNRIRQMRFCGQNMVIEGGYMYAFGYPSDRGESQNAAVDFDFNRLLLMMYRANGIKAYLSYEYTCSPLVTRSGVRSVGDRENWERAVQPADQVDRYGRQITGHGEAVNSFHPGVWQSMTNVLGELYARYGNLGVIEGIVAQTGWLWQPCFGNIAGDVTADEVGYDDLTVGAFERETGISLNLPRTGGARFARRYELLNGIHREAWRAWRTDAVKRKLDEMRAVVRTGREKWEFYVSPSLEFGRMNAVFASGEGSYADRQAYFPEALVSGACDLSLFDDRADATKLLLKVDYGKELQLANYGAAFNPSTRAVCRRFDTIYLAPLGLNEHIGTRVPLAKTWWWRSNGVAVFETKQAGENAFFDLTGVLADAVPRRFFHTWLDVNVPTAFAAEERRAAIGYYLVPEGAREPFTRITGVQAWRTGNDIQLVNNTPYPLEGVLKSRFVTATELATGRKISGSVRQTIPPFGLLTLRTRFPNQTLSGSFRFSSEDAARIEEQGRTLSSKQVRELLPAEFAAWLARARDVYEKAVLQRDFEALYAVETASGEAGRADYLNGRPLAPQTPKGEVKLLSWRAGEENPAVEARFPKGALQREDGRSFVRLRAGDSISLALRDKAARPYGRRVYQARVRVRGETGFCQFYGPWKTRYDIHLNGGRFVPGVVHWPLDGHYISLEVPRRYARATEGWHEIAVESDPKGDASVFLDGFLFGRRTLENLHQDSFPDARIEFSGGIPAKYVGAEVDLEWITFHD